MIYVPRFHGRELDVLDRRKGRRKGTQKSLFLTYIGRLFGSIKCTLNRDISQINFFLSLVNVKRELFSPLVIVGSQIFERPSGGRYGGRWISDRYLKSNIYQIFGVRKKSVRRRDRTLDRAQLQSNHVGDLFRLTIDPLHYLHTIAIYLLLSRT